MLYRAFSIVIFLSLDTHTSRRRKTSRNRRKRVFETSELKFFSIHSSKSFWNCSHKSLFVRLSFSHFLIFVSIHFFQFWISVFIQLWLRSRFARITTCRIVAGSRGIIVCEMSLSWLRGDFARVQGLAVIDDALTAERFCKNDGLRDRGCSDCEATRIWSTEIQKKRSPNQTRSRAADSKNSKFDWNRGSKAGRQSNSHLGCW